MWLLITSAEVMPVAV